MSRSLVPALWDQRASHTLSPLSSLSFLLVVDKLWCAKKKTQPFLLFSSPDYYGDMHCEEMGIVLKFFSKYHYPFLSLSLPEILYIFLKSTFCCFHICALYRK